MGLRLREGGVMPGHRYRSAKSFVTVSASEEELAAVHELLRACHEEISPLVPYRSPAETVGFLRFPPTDEDRPAWVVVDNGSLCAFAAVRRERTAASAWLDLHVHPAYRRRGAGSALLEAARSFARASDIGTLLGHYASAEAAGFCRLVGAAEGQRDVRSVAGCDQPLPVPSPVPGYRLVRWTGTCPEHLLDSYAQARTSINDAPHADADDENWNPRRVRDLETVMARRGRETRVTAAVDGDTVVAFTEIRVSPPPSSIASIEDTAVAREHRRIGLASWIKADSLATLRSQRSDVGYVTTSNAFENRPIRTINQRLGFVPAVLWTTAVLPA
jgi:GNAT superfamily N-acetyltransferase